ncbi:ATP-grasp domain-containing protein [Desulforhopalus sp. 52FAK]
MSNNLREYNLNLLPPEIGRNFLDDGREGLNTAVSGAKVLVVGTTSDYVALLRQSNPGNALYLTAESERNKAQEPRPSHDEEIVCDLEEDVSLIVEKIQTHSRQWGGFIDGVVCFDCESMALAAKLAEELSLPYPSLDSIRLCRDKFVTKTIWRDRKVACPRHKLVQTTEELVAFWREIDGPVVIKPLSGSGSELVFICKNYKECKKATHAILEGLAGRKEDRLYSKATTSFVAEEFVDGSEFSCDFTVKDGQVEILRLTKKIKYTNVPFGTIDGYMITDWQRSGINQRHLSTMLGQGAEALGFVDAVCMVDFIVDGDKILLLEMTPRPGGDCLPFLLHRAFGFDILSYCIDFSMGRSAAHPVPRMSGEGLVALRIHAERDGNVVKIDSNRLFLDPRTREISLFRGNGHRVTMPPLDYESWYLGYVLFQPNSEPSVELQCKELQRLLEVEMNNDNN